MLIKTHTSLAMITKNLWFKTSTANTGFIIILMGLFINFLIGIIPAHNFGYIGQAIWVLVWWGLFASIPGMFEDVYKRKTFNNEQDYLNVISDFKKSIIYGMLIISILVTSHIFRDKTKDVIAPIQTSEIFSNEPQIIPIHGIEIFDMHDKDDSYAIRYLDADGKSRFVDNYSKLESRNRVLEQILDSKGKIKVEIRFYKDKSQAIERIEIITKKINEGV